MRTLIALVVLVLALAYAVYSKTTPDAENLPPTSAAHDRSLGITTLGIASTEASATTSPKGQAVAAVSESTEAAPPNSEVNASTPDDIVVHEPLKPTLQPVPTPEPESVVASDNTIHYIVRENDTMYRIIINHYGTYSESILQAVSDANDLSDPSAIDIGDKILLPIIEGVGAPKKR